MDELTVGSKAPPFTLPNMAGSPVSLEKVLQGNWLVLYFYPKDDTPGCTIEAQDFTRLYSEFIKQKTQVFGISLDSPQSHCKFHREVQSGRCHHSMQAREWLESRKKVRGSHRHPHLRRQVSAGGHDEPCPGSVH